MAIILGFCLPGLSLENGVFWSRVVDEDGRAVGGARVSLRLEGGERKGETISDKAGWASLLGLPPGIYRLGVEADGYAPLDGETVWIESEGQAYRTLRLRKASGPSPSGVEERRDSVFPPGRTVISRNQMDALPTVHSVWSLIENQDFSATVDRIDVGGLWETIPALFSARGATSWTQNIYLLDGFDVTDPFVAGRPLLVPDFFSLSFAVLDNAALSVRTIGPGGVFHLIPREGTSEFHGGISAFYLDKTFTTSNITPELAAEGLAETNRLNRLMDVNLHLSGPVGVGRWRFSTSWTSQSVNRDLAGFEPEDHAELASGFVRLTQDGEKGGWRILWTGQIASRPTSGAGRGVPPETTFDERNTAHVVQVVRESGPRPRGAFRAGLSLAYAGLRQDFQENGPAGPSGSDILTGILTTTAPRASSDDRARLAAVFDGRTLVRSSGPIRHLLRYGLELRGSFSRSRQTVKDGLELRYFEGKPAEVVRCESPISHRESSAEIDVFAEETAVFQGGLSLTLGLHASGAYGRNPSASVAWRHLSPRLRVNLPLSRRRSSAIRISAARYYGVLPLSYLVWGNPDAPGGLAYRWTDANGDGLFQSAEQGEWLRREGPRYGAIDPDLRRPRTDEFAVAVVEDLGRGWLISAAGYLRESGDLVETVNTGVPLSSYFPVEITDLGDDRLAGTHDDLYLTVYGQKPETFGQDFHLLSNPGGTSRRSTYKGFDLVVWKRPTDKVLFFLALTATEAIQTTSPGNSAWENDDGVIGSLYDNPNAEINARGRPRFDRAYTARLGASFSLPFGFAAGAVVKYYDGQPFARKIAVTGLPQGPFVILAFPRGVARYEFNMTVDVRLEKRLNLGRLGTLRLLADVFNLFNQHLATEESPWTNDDFPRRFATEIQSPRVARLGVNFAF